MRNDHRALSRFREDERGAGIVEFALVLPILILVMTGIVQFGGIFLLQNNMTTVARDTARRVAVGEIALAGASAYAQGKLITWNSATFTVSATQPNANDIKVDISVPLAQASLVDITGMFQSGTLQASATMRKE